MPTATTRFEDWQVTLNRTARATGSTGKQFRMAQFVKPLNI
jgi:hypothetical protein